MIAGYTKPQELIQQILDNTPAGAEPRTLHWFTSGPQFDLFRYTNAAERAAMKGSLFVYNNSTDPTDRQVVPYEGLQLQIPDLPFTELYAENLEGQIFLNYSSGGGAGPYRVHLASLANPNQLRVTLSGTGVNLGIADDTLITELYGAPISFGDICYATFNSQTTRRQITGILRETVAATVGTDTDNSDGNFAASPNNPVLSSSAAYSNTVAPSGWTLVQSNAATVWNGLVAGSKYGANYAEKYTITITVGSVNGVGGKCQIRSASGAFSADNVSVVAVGDDFTITDASLGGVNLELTPTVPYQDVTVGLVFSFVVTAKYLPLALTGTKDLTLNASTFSGPSNTQYVITVVQGVSLGAVNDSFTGAIVRVADTAGIDIVQEYTVAHGTQYALGTFGLTFSFPAGVTTPSITAQPGLRTGDVYYINAVAAAATGPASIIQLAGQAADITNWSDADVANNLFDIDIRVLFTGLVDPQRDTPPDLAWTATANGVVVKEDLNLQIANRTSHQWVPVQASALGRLFVNWRGLVPAAPNETIQRYFSEASIISKFGAFDTDNPLCYGSIIAMRGAQGKSGYIGRLATHDLAGYTALLKQASRIDGIYACAPTEASADITAAFQAHVDSVSVPTQRLWRRVYVGITNTGPYALETVDVTDSPLLGQIQGNTNGNVRVVSTNATFLTWNLQPGDLYRTFFTTDEWNDVSSTDYVIESVVDEQELYLVSGPGSPVNPAIRFEIWRADTGTTQAQQMGAIAEAIQDRRVVTVWTDTPLISSGDINGDLIPTTTVYEACEVAGLRCALLPQQGLTMTEMDHSIVAAPTMFTKYIDSDLDIAAANGVWIVTQDSTDGPVYIRHQLTTQTNLNALYYEDSVGTNLDAISYAFKDLFANYIGKRNVTPSLVQEIYVRSQSLLTSMMSPPSGAPLAGPQIIAFLNLSVGIDAILKDRINLSVTLQMPLPLNTLFIQLTGTTTDQSTTITTQTLQTGASA